MQQSQFTDHDFPEIVELLHHYRVDHHLFSIYEEEQLRGFARIGRNPFATIEGLVLIIRALKRSNYKKTYLDNKFVDHTLLDKMWEAIK